MSALRNALPSQAAAGAASVTVLGSVDNSDDVGNTVIDVQMVQNGTGLAVGGGVLAQVAVN